MRILIVDDDEFLVRSLVRVVREWGAKVDFAVDADTAKQEAETTRYDFILLDLRMPGHDGLWFMQNTSIEPATRVIIMSGFAPHHALDELHELGMDGYLEKPFGPEDLMAVLESRSGAVPGDPPKRTASGVASHALRWLRPHWLHF